MKALIAAVVALSLCAYVYAQSSKPSDNERFTVVPDNGQGGGVFVIDQSWGTIRKCFGNASPNGVSCSNPKSIR